MLKDKFLETVNEYQMIKPGERVVVAVSGGADSIALLYLLESCKKELGITLQVAHLNHMIRRTDAELDVRFVQELAQRLGIASSVETMNVPEFAREKKMNLEAAARQLRYAFLEKVAGEVQAAKIAIGHTADDNVETFLMRLLRGSGLKGLCGIPVRRGKIIRPLIKIWRKEIEDYVGGLKLVPRRDHTNYESKYMRNRVRLKLIPQLKIYNLNIKEIILQTILLLTDDHQYLEAKAEEILEKAELSGSENELVLDIDRFKMTEDPIKGRLIRAAIEKMKGDLANLTYTHVHDVLSHLNEKEKWELHLPGGIMVGGDRGRLAVCREKTKDQEKKSYRYLLSVPGEVEIKELGRKVRSSMVEKAELEKANLRTVFVDYAVLGKDLVVRNWIEGDRFRPLGMRGTKKLQDLFVDEKIPSELRDTIPVIESRGEIVWVAGVRIDDRAKITRDTKKVVKIELL